MTLADFPSLKHRHVATKGIHSLAVARDLAEKYRRDAEVLERNLLQSLDKGDYDLEGYVVNVGSDFIIVTPKEQA